MSAENQHTEAQTAGLWDSPHRRYVAIAFGFSWLFWISGWILGEILDSGETLFNQDFVWRIMFQRDVHAAAVVVSLVSMIGVFGPMIGGFLAARTDPAIPTGHLASRIRRVNVGAANWRMMLMVLGLVTIIPLAVSVFSLDRTQDGPSTGQIFPVLLVLFVVQMLTSGTEEIGWRGYLVQKMLPGRNFWETGWAVGWVWAVWHYPVVIIMFVQAGMIPVQIIGSLAGFTMGIVAMSILHAWFYERTGSVFLNMVIHALFNTVPLTMVLVWEESPAALVSNLLLWAVVIYLRRREGIRD
jgi:membrane protease YdiL (CAAX protease family)